MRFLPEIGNSLLISWTSNTLDAKHLEKFIFISDKNRDNLCLNACIDVNEKTVVELQVFSNAKYLIQNNKILRDRELEISPYYQEDPPVSSYFNICLENHLRSSSNADLFVSANNESFEILLFKSGKLAFYDSSKFLSEEELCYQIAAIHKSFSNGEAKISLELSSELEPKIWSFCKRYFKCCELLKSDVRDICIGLDKNMLTFCNYSIIENYIKLL